MNSNQLPQQVVMKSYYQSCLLHPDITFIVTWSVRRVNNNCCHCIPLYQLMDLILATNSKWEVNKQSKTLQSWFIAQEKGILNLTLHFHCRQISGIFIANRQKLICKKKNFDHLKQTEINQHNVSVWRCFIYRIQLNF